MDALLRISSANAIVHLLWQFRHLAAVKKTPYVCSNCIASSVLRLSLEFKPLIQ
jgi:hypothetical protein